MCLQLLKRIKSNFTFWLIFNRYVSVDFVILRHKNAVIVILKCFSGVTGVITGAATVI